MHVAKLARERLKIEPAIPTRDTQSPPNVTPQTRIISVFRVDESTGASTAASHSLGNGWIISDF